MTGRLETRLQPLRGAGTILHPSSFFLAIALALASPSAMAQSYPSKPIRFFVPFGPYGIGDITARVVAQKMSD